MGDVEVTLSMRPPSVLQRIWCRRMGVPPPIATTHDLGDELARLLPYSWRRFHRRYATRHNLFWAPCILYNKPYGGHEIGGSIPDPIKGKPFEKSICSRCFRCRRKSGTDAGT